MLPLLLSCSYRYRAPTQANLNDVYGHLTNYS